MPTTDQQLHEEIRARYAAAAEAVTAGRAIALSAPGGCCSAGSCAPETIAVDESFGARLYGDADRGELPDEAVLASLGCGNPVAVAQLREGERVLDLGSGGGIDVLLSARRVGPGGRVFGLDSTEEMLALAQANKAKSGLAHVEFLKGSIEAVPLPGASVDVVISNCVINLSGDKPAVLAEMFRVLSPGGRVSICDVVAQDRLDAAQRAERGSHVGCIAGALSRQEYLDGLAAAGFVGADVEFTHEVADGMHGAIIRAAKPASCCAPEAQATCCSPMDKASCCADAASPAGCGCTGIAP